MSESYNKNRILKNSLLLYVRMLFTMWLNLWATRLVLANLGVEDMGVYGVVGSVVSTCTVLTGGVTNAIQRFITFELGRKDGKPNAVFCSSLNVIFILSLILFVLLEVVGLWILNHKVNIPEESRSAAQWVFQISVLTCIVNEISIPYNALIIAHERMGAFAGISVLQVVLSCAAAYCLTYFDQRLLWYAILMAAIGILIRIIYQVYCVRKIPDSQYHMIIDRSVMKDMMKFAGYSTANGLLGLVASQGITFVINWTFGVALNAVYNIALQLKNSILSFALNVQRAISPQITKTYASGELETHRKLVVAGSKMDVFMVYFIMIPFLFRTEYIMHLWLGNVPQYTVPFVRCIVFVSLAYAVFEPIRTSLLATSRIARFMVVPETVAILILPLNYAIGKYTGNATWLILSILGAEMASFFFRCWYAVKATPVSAYEIINRIILRCLLVAACSSAVCYGLSVVTSETILGLIILLAVNSLALCAIIYMVGLSDNEKHLVTQLMKKAKNSPVGKKFGGVISHRKNKNMPTSL